MEEKLFDIVILIGPNDREVIHKQIKYTKKNIIGYRDIFLVSYDPSIQCEGCITIDEKIFPFTVNTVSNIHGDLNRNKWYLQQLLKLYSGFVIPNILERYLVIDCDTFFFKPTTFIKDNKCLYNYGGEYHAHYFDHMLKLNKNLTKVYPDKSGICHHMMFEIKYIQELFEIIEKEHNDFFYNVFLNSVEFKEGSGASEYEIYFNYMVKNHSDEIIIRQLKWCNNNILIENEDYDYISIQFWML